FDMARNIRFSTRITSAAYDEASGGWTVETEDSETFAARWLIMATGPLSSTHIPPFPGREDFTGEVYHTGVWPHHPVDFTGKRVAMIGTGSSGVQATPVIARDAAQLTVLQRTPGHSWPARNRAMLPGEQEAVKARYPELREYWQTLPGATFFRTLLTDDPIVPGTGSAFDVSDEERLAIFERAWDYGGYAVLRAFSDLVTTEAGSLLVNAFIHEKISTIVSDQETAEMLKPRQLFGTKRLILDSDYYETFNQPHVDLVDVRSDPIERLTQAGIKTRDRQIDADMVIFATGFDAMTGSLSRIDFTGKDGIRLADVWQGGPQSYLGMLVSGFPNLFIIGGPQSCSALANVILANEQQVDWFCQCIRDMLDRDNRTIEPAPEAQTNWVEHIAELADASLYTKADSWYLGSNIEGKPRNFLLYLGGYPAYRARCEKVAEEGYEGFVLEPA
ncbi:MAG: NAD(P)/FAD-dependent oxidoreductase, partial [Novosphingobium sp.]|nr:NAD(P)/FAD-dependent oxidoreductase [Novosphingobium sp.]